MVVVPADNPVTQPDERSIVATVVLRLLHDPAVVASDNVVVPPAQTDVMPVIAAGSGFTVIVNAVKQPPVVVYVMSAVPAETPDNVPDEGLIVATAVLSLIHTPPVSPSASVML